MDTIIEAYASSSDDDTQAEKTSLDRTQGALPPPDVMDMFADSGKTILAEGSSCLFVTRRNLMQMVQLRYAFSAVIPPSFSGYCKDILELSRDIKASCCIKVH